MFTANEALKIIGRQAVYSVDGIFVDVLIKDFKVSYGVPRVLIIPLSGRGEKWVNTTTVSILPNVDEI